MSDNIDVREMLWNMFTSTLDTVCDTFIEDLMSNPLDLGTAFFAPIVVDITKSLFYEKLNEIVESAMEDIRRNPYILNPHHMMQANALFAESVREVLEENLKTGMEVT